MDGGLAGWKEGNVLFNDAHNTFYFRLYDVEHMVKDHSSRGKPAAATTWASLFDSLQGVFYMHHPIDGIAHTTDFGTWVVEHWLEPEIAQWVHFEGSIRRRTMGGLKIGTVNGWTDGSRKNGSMYGSVEI